MNKFYTSEKISEKIEETPEGFLIAYDVPVAKIGEQVYKGDEVPIEPNAEGLVTIKRTEEEVFKPEAISSFEGKPFTIDHPDEMVTPENWKDLAHGFITNLRRGAREKFDLLIGDIVITTNKAIELVKGGMREISCGYDADYEQLDKGVGIQKNIVGNHIALVMRGRAGHRCAIGDKQCTNCGNCNCKNNKVEEDEDAMKFKAKLKNVYRRLMKDADFEQLPDDEKADKLAEAAADQVEEEGMLEEQAPVEEPVEEMSEEPMEEPASVGGGEITNGQLMETMVKLINIIEAFVKTAAGVGDEESVPKPMPTEEENKPYVNDENEGTEEECKKYAGHPIGDSKTKDEQIMYAVVFENTVMEKPFHTESAARNFISQLHGSGGDRAGYSIKKVKPGTEQGDIVRDSKTKDAYEFVTKYKDWEIYRNERSLTFPFVAYDVHNNVVKGFSLLEIKAEIDKRKIGDSKPYVNDEGGGSLLPSGGLPKIAGNSPVKIPASSPVSTDEDPDEKEERERMEAKDCDSRWYDIAYRADLLYPGIRLSKPTRDHRAVVDRIKIKALKNAYTTDAEVVGTIVGNKKVDSLKGEALDVAFMAVSEAIKQKNNRMVKDSVIVQSGKVVSEIQRINQKNKEFWKKN